MKVFSLSLLSLFFWSSAVSASDEIVTVSFAEDEGERRLEGAHDQHIRKRFLQDVVVQTDLSGGCGVGGYCGGSGRYQCWRSDGSTWTGGNPAVPFTYTPSNTVTNIEATIYGNCAGLPGARVYINGILLGTVGPVPGLNMCTCGCNNAVISSNDPTLMASIGGTNSITVFAGPGLVCMDRIEFDFTIADAGGDGDPHFHTWKNEHFEFHGQCDLVMTHVKNFADKGIDIAIHLRTKMVRYWSYIKTASIRIGEDTLEVEGSTAKEDGVDKLHYRINSEYRGELDTVGGYPVTINDRNNKYTIDLGKDFPGQKIEVKTFKEFVSVKVVGATAESFGTAVGMTGDFTSGKTLGRDGVTEIDDFNDLGLEWQVVPSDGKLFYESANPQFPELCYLPEDPRGDRARRLAESNITEEAAEEACAGLKDELDRKDCIYDVLATQDMDMVGAY